MLILALIWWAVAAVQYRLATNRRDWNAAHDHADEMVIRCIWLCTAIPVDCFILSLIFC